MRLAWAWVLRVQRSPLHPGEHTCRRAVPEGARVTAQAQMQLALPSGSPWQDGDNSGTGLAHCVAGGILSEMMTYAQ